MADSGAVLARARAAHDQARLIEAETAAIIMGLDLLITCDTVLAHLAGALGARVWVALA